MREALRLAQRGRELVSPNPMVGAVLVRGARVVASGWHRRWGGAHAEVEALRGAGRAARGADLYVTLEPCGHQGKTPPCAAAVAAAGVRRVVYAVGDPNPATRGRGPRLLRRAGVLVEHGLLRDEALALNASYFHWRRTGLPWVILKWAMSLDGKIAAASGDARWISNERSRRHAHALRRRVDAILVGSGTYRTDDPNLLPRPPRGRQPLRVVLDRRGRLPLTLQVFRADGGPRLYVTSSRTPARRLREVEGRGLAILRAPVTGGALDLEFLLRDLGQRGVSQLLVEGGGRLHGSFRDAGLAQELAVFIAPRVIGGETAPGPVGGAGVSLVAEAWRLENARVRRLDGDLLLEGHVAR